MKQTERLLQIVNLLRNRKTVLTAQQLADEFDVSLRTIYRDVQKMESSGIPIEGEAGVGYRIRRSFELPPLMFDANEVEALMLGVKMVRAWSDKQLSASAQSALNKIVGALSEELKGIGDDLPFKVPVFADWQEGNTSETLRSAIKNRWIIRVQYLSLQEVISEREVLPLGLFFWGNVWTLVAWCQLRGDYRSFRIDRLSDIQVLEESFEASENCSLEHFMSTRTGC